MMYKLEQFDNNWAVKDTEINEYFDFASRYEHWWGKYSFFDDGDCFTDYDTALAKLKELGGEVEEIASQNTEIEENTMSEYKNAGIKSKKELAQRLIDGEVFYFDFDKIHYDKSVTEGTPFRCKDGLLHLWWDEFEKFTTKTEWYENIPEEGVLCWVNDVRNKAVVIVEFDAQCFYDNNGGAYFKDNLTPVTKEDLL